MLFHRYNETLYGLIISPNPNLMHVLVHATIYIMLFLEVYFSLYFFQIASSSSIIHHNFAITMVISMHSSRIGSRVEAFLLSLVSFDRFLCGILILPFNFLFIFFSHTPNLMHVLMISRVNSHELVRV